MALGPTPGGEPGADVMTEMNITPLIDVMLVLLVMLIITIPIQLHSVNVDTPASQAQAAQLPPVVVRLAVNSSGQVLWDDELVPDLPTLESRLQAASVLPVQPEIHVRPDLQARYDVVAAVLTAAQRQGLAKVGVVGLEQFAPRP